MARCFSCFDYSSSSAGTSTARLVIACAKYMKPSHTTIRLMCPSMSFRADVTLTSGVVPLFAGSNSSATSPIVISLVVETQVLYVS
jgi:hypothetical protein